MNKEELNKMQTKILKKNKICNYTLGILLLLILFITLIIVINKGITFIFIIYIIFIEIIFGIAMMIIIKNIINGKDIKKFNKEYKNVYVLNFLKQNFEDIIYKPEEGISKKEIKKYNTLNLGDKFTSNDYIYGTYKNVKFEQSDIHIQKKYEEEDKDGNKIMNEIPYGKTISYAEISNQIANIKQIKKMSAQAVGYAVGSNPICIIVPCHRVIGKSGKLVGYGGGLENKIELLKLENSLNKENIYEK